MMQPPSPEPPGRLTLIGTIHQSGGYSKLVSLLALLRPDRLTLEMSPYALAFRLRNGAKLLQELETILDQIASGNGNRADLGRHPQVDAIRAFLALPFEYRAARDWCRQTSIPCELIDSSLISARKLRRAATELVTLENVRTLVSLPVDEGCGGDTASVARPQLKADTDAAVRLAFLARRRGSEGIGERDRRLAEALRLRIAPGKHLVHIGGWVHLVDDPRGETLFSRLADIRPKRLLAV